MITFCVSAFYKLSREELQCHFELKWRYYERRIKSWNEYVDSSHEERADQLYLIQNNRERSVAGDVKAAVLGSVQAEG